MKLLFPVLATLIWAASTVVNRLSVGVIDPAAISFYRWLTALLVLSPVMLPRVWRMRQRIRPYLPKLWLLGLLGMSLYQSLAYFAAHTVSATSMGLILATMPLLTVLVAFPLLNTRPTLPLLTGTAVSFAGLAWLLTAGHLPSLWQRGVGLGEMADAAGVTVLRPVLRAGEALANPPAHLGKPLCTDTLRHVNAGTAIFAYIIDGPERSEPAAGSVCWSIRFGVGTGPVDARPATPGPGKNRGTDESGPSLHRSLGDWAAR